MNTDTAPTPALSGCTAFLQGQRVAHGPYAEVASALASLDLSAGGLLVFDDRSGAQVDHPWPAEGPGAPTAPEPEVVVAAAPQVGRPRMGVVAREVTLLPRHWAWLSHQPGGASAALRRLVEDARRTHAARDGSRLAKERAYRFMSAIASGYAGFEEASRALFAQDADAFHQRIAAWPHDVQAHLTWLARDAFDTPHPSEAQAG